MVIPLIVDFGILPMIHYKINTECYGHLPGTHRVLLLMLSLMVDIHQDKSEPQGSFSL